MAGNLDISIEQGTTARRKITRKLKSDLSLVSMVGYTARMQVRASKKPNDNVVLDELSTANDRIVVNLDGSITLVFPEDVTSDYTFTTGFYDLLVTPPGGDTIRVLEGRILVSVGITR